MENASKALIMAAEVIIGVLVLSLMSYLFVTFSSNSSEIIKQMDENKLTEFNNQYDKYKGKSDVTIYDIVSLASLARENNEYYELENSTDSNYYIKVYLDGKGYIEKKENKIKDFEEKMTYLIKDGMNNTYKCNKDDVKYSNVTGRVKEIHFRKNTN